MSPEPDPIHRLFALSVERSRMSSCLLIPVTLLGRSFITPTGGTSIWSPLLVFITVLMIAIAIMRASKTPIIIPSMSDMDASLNTNCYRSIYHTRHNKRPEIFRAQSME